MPHPPKPLRPSRSAADWFGAELRHLRLSCALTQRDLGASVHVSGDLIGKIEKADRPCTLSLAAALDSVLDSGGVLARCLPLVFAEADRTRHESDKLTANRSYDYAATAAGSTLKENAASRPDRSVDASVERRNFLAVSGLAALTTGPPLNRTAPADGPVQPNTVGPRDIEQVETAATTLRGWDHLYGSGGIVRGSAAAQLGWARALLACRCPEGLRTGLLRSVSRLGMVAGAISFDAYAHDDARRFFALSTACAEEADAWHLRAKSYNLRSRQAIQCGDPDAGLTLAELGLTRADRLTHTEQAMLHAARARAFATMGRVPETLAAVRAADDHFARSSPGEDPPWMAYYDEAQHHGDTGHALHAIALLGHEPSLAVRRLRTAVDGHSAAYVRSGALSRTKLASLLMATGDPQEGAAVGHRALAEVGRIRSRRASDGVRELLRLSGRHPKEPGARELAARITAAVAI